MMKRILFFTIAALCLNFASCDKDKEYGDVKLNVDRLNIYPGMSYSVHISGGSGEYTVSIWDPEVADIYINGRDSLMIEAGDENALTNITVTDAKSGKTANCSVIVNTGNFNGGWSIDETDYVIDASWRTEIEADLKSKLFPAGYLFQFDPDADGQSYGAGHWYVVKINEISRMLDTLACGTFVSMPVTLDGIAEAYAVLPIEQEVYSAKRYVFEQEDGQHVYDVISVLSPGHSMERLMYEDRTEYYRAKYPDAGVRAVVCRYAQRNK